MTPAPAQGTDGQGRHAGAGSGELRVAVLGVGVMGTFHAEALSARILRRGKGPTQFKSNLFTRFRGDCKGARFLAVSRIEVGTIQWLVCLELAHLH